MPLPRPSSDEMYPIFDSLRVWLHEAHRKVPFSRSSSRPAILSWVNSSSSLSGTPLRFSLNSIRKLNNAYDKAFYGALTYIFILILIVKL
jgi:hypothetical protein